MSYYDYVYLLSEAMSYMTMLTLDLYIHFQFIFIFIIFSTNFIIYLFLMTNEINLFLNIDGRLFTFVFAPCALVVNP